MALAYMGLRHAGSGHAIADSADPTWLDRESPPPTVPVINDDEEPRAAPPQVCLFFVFGFSFGFERDDL